MPNKTNAKINKILTLDIWKKCFLEKLPPKFSEQRPFVAESKSKWDSTFHLKEIIPIYLSIENIKIKTLKLTWKARYMYFFYFPYGFVWTTSAFMTYICSINDIPSLS